MPCGYFDSLHEDRLEREKSARESRESIARLKSLLCDACANLQLAGKLSPELSKWYKDHKKEDEQRRLRAEKLAEKVRMEIKFEEHLKSVSERLKRQLTGEEIEAIRKYGV